MTGDKGIFKTRRMTPHRDFQCLEFFQYHSGHDTDQLNIWIREFQSEYDTVGASRLIGQITGEELAIRVGVFIYCFERLSTCLNVCLAQHF